METVLAFIETKDGEPRKVSLELLSEGRKLAREGRFVLEAVAFGKISETAKEKVCAYADRFVHITDPVLDLYTAEGYALALCRHAEATKPAVILAGATRIGRDFLPRTAVLLKTGIASDVTEIRWSEDPIKVIRPMYGGKVLAEVSFTSAPAIITVRPNSFGVEAPDGKVGEYTQSRLALPPGDIRTQVKGVEGATRSKADLTEADLIVSGGRGLKSAENFKLIEDMAEVIGATVGATRSVVDAKWRDQGDQVGKSGKTVSPKLYIAAGISGAIHHIMGMDTSKVVLAINKDPNAIIFNYADYGIAGDALEILPLMTEELKKRMGK